MEPPISFEADVVRDEQAKILKAIQPMTPEEVLTRTVRGQYGEGVDGDEQDAGLPRRSPMCRPTRAPKPSSRMKLFIDNWRWADVPVLSAHRQAAAEARDRDRRSSSSARRSCCSARPRSRS